MSPGRDPTERLVARLKSLGFDPRPTGSDSWESRCPAHDGDRRNLSVSRGDDGRTLVHCHARDCPAGDIAAALDLDLADLFPPRYDRPTPTRPRANGKARADRKAHPTPEAAIGATARKLGNPTAAWTYHLADGTEAARVYRFDPEGERKEFRPVHLTSEGWVMGDPPGLWPLYHRCDLADSGRVYVVEGEKACDLARNLGATATTSAHGAKSAHKTDWSPLAGLDVVIVPDTDPEGEGYSQAVIAELAKLSPRPTARVVRLADLWRTDAEIIKGADIEEWLQDGVPDGWEPEQCREELDRVAELAPMLDLNPPPPAEPRDAPEPPVGPAWPEPPEAPAFDGLAGEIVRAIEPHTEADPVAILGQLLIGFGNMIGRTAFFAVEADRHYGNEFLALVGETAKGRKGTSWSHARRLLDAADPAWTGNRVLNGLSTGEGLIHAVRDPVMKREPIKEGASKRITGYQEVEVDPGETDKRILCIESELGGTLRVATRDGNNLSALVRQAWDSSDLRTLTRNNPLKATGAHVSIVGHITRDELATLLTRTDAANGFANRFLWFCVRRSKLLPFGGSIGDVDFAPLVRRLTEAAEAARTRGRMVRDTAADELWAASYPELSEGRPGLLGAVTSRAEAHTMRLAMLYALIDGCPMIHADHLQSALALWRYAERSAAHIFGDALGDPDADSLLDALRASMPEGLTRTEIREGVFQKNKSSERIAGILRMLTAANLAFFRMEPTGGRSAERWFAGREPTP
jgi:hypothetical protein